MISNKSLDSPKLYLIYTNSFNENQLNFLSHFADKYIVDRIHRFRNKKDIVNVLSTNVLRKYISYKDFNLPFDCQEIKFNKYGKPYYKNSNLYFNVSHSGNMGGCVFWREEVGMDIQKIIKYNRHSADYLFTLKEVNLIEKSANKDLEYTKIWAKKESILKLIGRGFVNYKKCTYSNIVTKTIIINDYVVAYSFYKSQK